MIIRYLDPWGNSLETTSASPMALPVGPGERGVRGRPGDSKEVI